MQTHDQSASTAEPMAHPEDRALPARWRRLAQGRPIACFIALAVGLSWLVWLPGLLWVPAPHAVTFTGAFGPAVAGAIMVRSRGGRVRDWLRGMLRFRVPLRWYAVVLGLPLIEPAAQAVVLAQAGLPLAFEELPGRLPMFAVGFMIALLLGGGQEEPGWRGWLLPRLQAGGHSALAASLVIGVVWAVWHVPMFVFGIYEHSFLLYLVLVLAVSVIFTWLYNATHSVVLAMLLHAHINSSRSWLPFAEELLVAEAVQGYALAVQAAITAGFIAVAALLVARYGTQLRPRRARQVAADATSGDAVVHHGS